ncbi:GTP-binding protein, HSR1-related [Alkaliphilus metalliredigens QYMF]|uniref:GTP-binding protein, HSR1-related n=1 Tax=Alkaliphilus metalliredigens (strain QYMF) TaxID=293826 RepID=A6TR74_ALKMQ|nr:GTPase [Alkaliphilus metalliredigens]ABR48692.1 GTP-binding protein, HSR1-related [Alkaliphilus metalliredigens QYMF]
MPNCILIGKPNVGKTTLFLNFAEYLGVDTCEINVLTDKGEVRKRHYAIDIAKNMLIGPTPFKTKEVYEIHLSIPVYKGTVNCTFLDTGGLIDGIPQNDQVRTSMIQTLSTLQDAEILLHIIDVWAMDKNEINSLSQIDYQINEFASLKKAYCILANKMDKVQDKRILHDLKKKFPSTYIIPISATKKIGFKEVSMFVGRNS